MGHGLRNIIKVLILALFLFLVACMPNRVKIANLQSEVVTLTIDCDKGNQDSCNSLVVKKEELINLLN